jgi:tetratricopeptide (TPR) repeat protein
MVIGAAVAIFAVAPRALAQDSVSVLGNTPAADCAQAAAIATAKGTASRSDLLICNQAIAWALREPPSSRAAAVLNRGVLHLARAEFDAAVADFNAALKIQGDLSEAVNDRGLAHMARRHLTDAVADFSTALDLKPAQPAKIYFNRAMAKEDLGDVKGAYFDYRKAAELDPAWETPKDQLKRFTVTHAGMS